MGRFRKQNEYRNQVKVSLSTIYKAKKKNFYRKGSFKGKSRVEDLTKKWKERFLTALATAIKDPTISIRKYTNELKVHEKTVRIEIKQDLSPVLNPLDYAIWGVLEHKTNVTSHPSLRTAIKGEGNKISEEFILKTQKSFLRCVDTNIEKKDDHIEWTYCSMFIISFFFFFEAGELSLILLYNRVVYHYTRILLILLPYPVN